MQRRFFGVLLLAATIGAAGCDNEVENATTPPPPAPTTTEVFTGTVNVNGAQTHTFNVLANGTVQATLTELGTTDTAITVGLTLGTWTGTSCATVIANDAARQGNTVIGSVTGVGTLCVRIHDVGKMTGALTYTLTVEHP